MFKELKTCWSALHNDLGSWNKHYERSFLVGIIYGSNLEQALYLVLVERKNPPKGIKFLLAKQCIVLNYDRFELMNNWSFGYYNKY